MEKGLLELGEVDLIQDTTQSLDLDCEDNHRNLFPPSTYVPPAENGEIDIIQDTVQSLLDCVKEEHNHTNKFPPASIYMAPRILRDLSPSLFNPRVVSIGPLHREDENVQAFDRRKATYLINLMNFINSPQEEILSSCVQKVYASMEQIKACYVWTNTYGDAQIAKMMVMDACFILGFNHQFSVCRPESYLGEILLFQNIMYDLVLLENQIPFFVLDAIFQCTVLKFQPNVSLIELISPILRGVNIFETEINIKNIFINNIHHILSLLHECYKPPPSVISSFETIRIPSAVDLERAGVNFKPNRNPLVWVMGMEVKLYRFLCCFGPWGNPTLRIPELNVGDVTELVLRNLIAYEQSSETRNHITSYCSAMDMLVNTREDVAKLVDSRVLVNHMGSNEEAANMINSICKDVTWGHFYYKEEWEKLNNYCNGYWPKNIAWLRRTYFNSPWTMIALLAGIILFALTVVQTIFTIKSDG